MITSSLAFESIRKTGRLPQLAVFVELLTRTVVFAQDGITGVDQRLRRFDGSWRYDGSVQYGATVEDLYYGVISVSPLNEGDEGAAGSLEIQPSRRGTLSVEVPNPTKLMSELIASDPIIGATGKLILTFPGLTAAARVTRFAGEVSRVTLTRDRMRLEIRSA